MQSACETVAVLGTNAGDDKLLARAAMPFSAEGQKIPLRVLV
jgi:hypothetical protein